jgi:hypothetical protein
MPPSRLHRCDVPLAARSAPRSDEDHQSTPDDHRRFGDAGPRRVPSVFVGAAPNADDSHNDVGKRKEMETDGDSVGQASEDRSDGGRRRQNIGDGAIGDGVVPKGLAKRKIATPKRYQCVSHDARALFEFRGGSRQTAYWSWSLLHSLGVSGHPFPRRSDVQSPHAII